MQTNYRVLITTSGTGSRLGDFTKYTNKCLVRVGDKPALSYIIENYPEDTEFVITLGYKGDLVKQFVQVAYPNLKVDFVEVPVWEGEGSSLGFSMFCASPFLQCPFVFHASDTLVEFSPGEGIYKNTVVAGYQKSNSNYRSLQVDGITLAKILEKGDLGNNPAHIGVVWIHEYNDFWSTLATLLATKEFGQELSDAHVINAMKSEFFVFDMVNWLDVGNADSLREARGKVGESFVSLDKVDQATFLFKNTVVKFFAEPGTVSKRIDRARCLDEAIPHIEYCSPNFFSYRKAHGKLATDCMTPEKFINFLGWCDQELWWLPKVDKIDLREECRKFYYDKTLDRIEKFYTIFGGEDREEVINGVQTPTLAYILDRVPWEELYNAHPTSKFHGDLHFSNILCDKDEYKLIDWREDFGGNVEYGDAYYDLAKINHGLIVSHDIIDKGLYSVEAKSDSINFEILRKYQVVECQKVFYQWLRGHNYSIEKTDILTALVFLNIAALHHYPYSLLLYYLGKSLLYKAVCWR